MLRGLICAALLVSLLGSSIALAASPNGNSSSFGGCEFSGYSDAMGDQSTYDDFSQTGRPPFTYCVDLMRVYAYFCASDGQWYMLAGQWDSGTSYAATSTPYWGYWSNRVYGYHRIQEPTGTYSQEITTDAFLAVTCP